MLEKHTTLKEFSMNQLEYVPILVRYNFHKMIYRVPLGSTTFAKKIPMTWDSDFPRHPFWGVRFRSLDIDHLKVSRQYTRKAYSYNLSDRRMERIFSFW